METCEECGSRIYNLGCINCNEMDYVNEQAEWDAFNSEMMVNLEIEYQCDYVNDELNAFEVSENIRNQQFLDKQEEYRRNL